MDKRTNNDGQNSTQTTKSRTLVLRKGKQFLFHMCHPSCYSFYEAGDKPWKQKGLDCDYDKRNITVVICDSDFP